MRPSYLYNENSYLGKTASLNQNPHSRMTRGVFQNTYELINLGTLKISLLNGLHIFLCTGKIFVWNFIGYLWNFIQNILPIHWKLWFLYNDANRRDPRTYTCFLNGPVFSTARLLPQRVHQKSATLGHLQPPASPLRRRSPGSGVWRQQVHVGGCSVTAAEECHHCGWRVQEESCCGRWGMGQSQEGRPGVSKDSSKCHDQLWTQCDIP